MATPPSDLPGATTGVPSTASTDTPSPATPWRDDPPGLPPDTGPSDLLNRVAQGAHETIDRLAQTAAPHVERWHEQVDGAGERLHRHADEWADGLRTQVRANPLASVAAALALGMLIARLAR